MTPLSPLTLRDPERSGRHRARARLVALSTRPDRTLDDHDDPPATQVDPVELGDGAVDGVPAEVDPVEPGDGAAPSAGADGRVGRLVRQWTPGALRDARWEPGRPGALLLAAVAALAAVVAAVGVWRDRPVAEAAPALPVVAAPAVSGSAAPAPDAPLAELVVSVVGRVARPGLVRVPDGARVADALDAAGGALPDTDLAGLNLARRVADGEQLLVGIAPPLGLPVDPAVAPPSAAGAPGGPVDLNTATLEQLDTLPGVGPVTAQRIVDWRAANGRFSSVDQLREVGGIGEARFAQLRDLVRV